MWHIPKWKVAYTRFMVTRKESGICQMETGMYQNGKWHIVVVPYSRVAYTNFICEIYLCFPCMIDIALWVLNTIDAGQCSRGRVQTQSFPAKSWDKSFALQCVNLVPQESASSMICWTLIWAHHTSYCALLHTRDHTGAALFMRSTPGCETLAGPSTHMYILVQTSCGKLAIPYYFFSKNTIDWNLEEEEYWHIPSI